MKLSATLILSACSALVLASSLDGGGSSIKVAFALGTEVEAEAIERARASAASDGHTQMAHTPPLPHIEASATSLGVSPSPLEDLALINSGQDFGSGGGSNKAALHRRPLPEEYMKEHHLVPQDDPEAALSYEDRREWWPHQQEIVKYLQRASLPMNEQLEAVSAFFQRFLDAKGAGNLRSASRTLSRDPALLHAQKLQQEELQRTQANSRAILRRQQEGAYTEIEQMRLDHLYDHYQLV